MTTYSNGHIPQSAIDPITKAANGEQAYLRKDVARAFMAMNSESERRFNVTLRATSARTAYRPYEEQEYFWKLYKSGKGNLAAVPGTSNHGLGLAIDIATQEMRRIVDIIGEKYGFAKKWSDAPTEWWHIKWKEGSYPAISKEKWYGYTSLEKRYIQEYDRIKRKNIKPKRRKIIQRLMAAQAHKIYIAAKVSGWTKRNRRKRYLSLKTRSK